LPEGQSFSSGGPDIHQADRTFIKRTGQPR